MKLTLPKDFYDSTKSRLQLGDFGANHNSYMNQNTSVSIAIEEFHARKNSVSSEIESTRNLGIQASEAIVRISD